MFPVTTIQIFPPAICCKTPGEVCAVVLSRPCGPRCKSMFLYRDGTDRLKTLKTAQTVRRFSKEFTLLKRTSVQQVIVDGSTCSPCCQKGRLFLRHQARGPDDSAKTNHDRVADAHLHQHSAAKRSSLCQSGVFIYARNSRTLSTFLVDNSWTR